MMAGRGSYHGGSTIIHAGSNWFSHTSPGAPKSAKAKVAKSKAPRKVNASMKDALNAKSEENLRKRRAAFLAKRNAKAPKTPEQLARIAAAATRAMNGVVVERKIKPRLKPYKLPVSP